MEQDGLLLRCGGKQGDLGPGVLGDLGHDLPVLPHHHRQHTLRQLARHLQHHLEQHRPVLLSLTVLAPLFLIMSLNSFPPPHSPLSGILWLRTRSKILPERLLNKPKLGF